MSLCHLHIPNLRIRSELNLREHWTSVAKRKRTQRELVAWGCLQKKAVYSLKDYKVKLRVTLTRLAPRYITDEHENLRAGFKAVVDELSKQLGFDDGDTNKVEWKYAQEKSTKPKEYGIIINIEEASW